MGFPPEAMAIIMATVLAVLVLAALVAIGLIVGLTWAARRAHRRYKNQQRFDRLAEDAPDADDE